MIPFFSAALSQLIGEFPCVAWCNSNGLYLQSLFTFMNEINYFFSVVVKQWGGIRQTGLILCYYSCGDLLIFLNIKFLEEQKWKDKKDL